MSLYFSRVIEILYDNIKFITKVHLLFGNENPANIDAIKGIISGIIRMIRYVKMSFCFFLFFMNCGRIARIIEDIPISDQLPVLFVDIKDSTKFL